MGYDDYFVIKKLKIAKSAENCPCRSIARLGAYNWPDVPYDNYENNPQYI